MGGSHSQNGRASVFLSWQWIETDWEIFDFYFEFYWRFFLCLPQWETSRWKLLAFSHWARRFLHPPLLEIDFNNTILLITVSIRYIPNISWVYLLHICWSPKPPSGRMRLLECIIWSVLKESSGNISKYCINPYQNQNIYSTLLDPK